MKRPGTSSSTASPPAKPRGTRPPEPPSEPSPGSGGPNRRLAAEIDAREYRRHRPDLMLLMGCAAIVVMLLVAIVRTHLDAPDAPATPQARSAAGAAAPAPAATDPVAARVFETALAELRTRGASDPEAPRRTAAYRALLAAAIGTARLEIEAFECGPRLCMGSVRGDARAYAALHAALEGASSLPVHAFVDGPGEHPGASERADARHRFMFSIEPGAGETGAPAPQP